MKDQASVIVAKPPTNIHVEVDGVMKTAEVINFSESKSRKVKTVVESLLGLLVLFQMYTEPFFQMAVINCLEPGQLFGFQSEISTLPVTIFDCPLLQVSCVSDGARPAVKFSWRLGEDPYTGRVKDLPAEASADGSLKQVQELQYTAEPSHNGKRLVCSVENSGYTQEDIAQQRNQVALELDVQFQPVAADHPEIFYNIKKKF